MFPVPNKVGLDTNGKKRRLTQPTPIVEPPKGRNNLIAGSETKGHEA
jgi:hypothetical protein